MVMFSLYYHYRGTQANGVMDEKEIDRWEAIE